MPWSRFNTEYSIHQVQHTPSTAYIEYSMHRVLQMPCTTYIKYSMHRVLHMPSTAYTEYSIHRVQHTPSTAYTEYSIHRVQHTPSTAYTEYSIHRVQHTPSTAYTEYSIHWVQRPPMIVCPPFILMITCWPLNVASASSMPPYMVDCHQLAWQLEGEVTESHSHGGQWTNWSIESQHPACHLATASKRSSNLALSRPPSVSPN